MADKITTVGVSVDYKTKALEIAYDMTNTFDYGEGKAYADGRAEHIRQLVKIMTGTGSSSEGMTPPRSSRVM